MAVGGGAQRVTGRGVTVGRLERVDNLELSEIGIHPAELRERNVRLGRVPHHCTVRSAVKCRTRLGEAAATVLWRAVFKRRMGG